MISKIQSIWKKILEKINNNLALKAVAITFVVLIFLSIIWGILKTIGVSGTVHAIVFGVLVGLFGGYLMQTKIPSGMKFGTIGLFGGMGLDLAASFNNQEETLNAVNSVSSFLGNLATRSTAIPKDSPEAIEYLATAERLISTGLWVTIGVLFLVLIVASFVNRSDQAEI